MNQPSQYAGAFTSVLWFCAVLGMTVTAKVKATTEGTLLHNPTCPAEYALVLDWLIAFNLPPNCKVNLPVVANPSDHSLQLTYHLNQNSILIAVLKPQKS